jgi:hypothetical protein
MSKPKYVALGSVLLIYGMFGLDSKETYFSWDGYFFVFNPYDNFTEYWIALSFVFYFGIKYLVKGLIDKQKDYLEPLSFSNKEEYNNFKIAEKSLRSLPYIYLIIGFVCAFPFGFLAAYVLNVNISDLDNCIKCQGNGDWWTLVFFSSMILLPIIFFKLSFKIKSKILIKNGVVSKSNLKHMRLNPSE